MNLSIKRSWSMLSVAVLLVGTAVGAVTEQGRVWIHWIDRVWLGEFVIDSLTRLRSNEDWAIAEPLSPNQDYAWLAAQDAPFRIAHGLGESRTETANTIGAMQRAYAAGFRLFEVDLVLENGELQCKHDPGPRPLSREQGCTFQTLSAALPEDAWLILDIKTDFAVAGQQIVDGLKGEMLAQRLIFQLYRPEHFALFKGWQEQKAFPGPILTTYRAYRRMDHIAANAMRLGVRAFAFPIERLPALRSRPAGAALLTHPIHDCASSFLSSKAGVDGTYTLSSLRCAPRPTSIHP